MAKSRRVAASLLALALLSTVSHATAQAPTIMDRPVTRDDGSRAESQPVGQSGQAQQMMKEARVELERAALALADIGPSDRAEAIRAARDALSQFEQSLEQLDQSIPGFVPPDLAKSLLEQVSATFGLLDTDTDAAQASMLELTLRVTDVTAEADLFLGRTVLGPDGNTLGRISNVLITPDGRMQALVIDRTDLGTRSQFIIEWSSVTIEGTDLIAEIGQGQSQDLPDYLSR